MANLLNVPGGGEVWKVDGDSWLVYYVPNTNPPVPMAWKVTDQQQLQAMFGPDQPINYDRQISGSQFRQTGAVNMGVRTEISNESEHPFEVFTANFEKESEIRPWLRDPEVLAITAAAILEGREVTEAELKTTNWWKNHSDAERKWMTQREADPATATQQIADNRFKIEQALRKSGLTSPSQQLVNRIADKMTSGQWTEGYVNAQIDAITNPQQRWRLDNELEGLFDPTDRLREGEDKVRGLIQKWLGPKFSAGWDDEFVQEWAAEFRNNPDAKQDLEDILRDHFQAVFPEYADNPNNNYESIAGPWRSFMQDQWGTIPDETDPVFAKVLRLNDSQEATALLRQEGLKRGVDKVVNQAFGKLTESLNGGVR